MSWEDSSEYAGFDNKTPSPQDVSAFHTNSDKDSSAYAQHHTLGKGVNQAAPGNHEHLYPLMVAVANSNIPVIAGGWATLDDLIAVNARDISITGGANENLTVSVAGLYKVTAVLYFDSLTAGYRACRFNVDGVIQEYVSSYQSGAGAFISVRNSITVNLDEGSSVAVQGGTETAMNIRGAASGLGLSRIELEFVR